ncbi:uncharacterized protein A1O9_05747 [Exophiala aquamarina CBS 119918]|uniref:Uncharacterized protein n=1 Tax=Exophiala aquamarina CBS 119918 TaxID=1182545 RepID=A0A072PDK5_9EURO|nr:uncharacterized protein A1O9_05747 [Exophiala aquamarina CBS 119918]KEF57827.1 hypothetical protein A1O9_05747 [Exophiala aquamarina CBS 119918]
MEFPFNRSSQSRSIPTTSNGRTLSSSWRSIFRRRRPSASSTEAFYPTRYPRSGPLDQQHMVSYKQSYLPQHQALGRSSSILSWSPFRKKDRIETDSLNLTAGDVYQKRKAENSTIPHLYPSRSKTIDTRTQIATITPVLRYPTDKWPDTHHNFQQVDFQSPIGPEEASEAIFTLTEPPNPEARITVQYSPRKSSWDRTERRMSLDASVPIIGDLAEHDSDKRNEVFARVDAEGWNQSIPKQWVDNGFSEEGAKTTASRSLYSGDDSGDSQNGGQVEQAMSTLQTKVEPERRSESSSKATSRLAKTSNPRFVFEDCDDEPEQRKTQCGSHEDQVWWQNLTKPLCLCSTPYHQTQECPANRLPRAIETVSQFKRSGNNTAPHLRSLLPSDSSQRRELIFLSKSYDATRSSTIPPCLLQESRMSPQNKARRAVDEFFNVADTESLCPPPLRPRHEESNCDQSRKPNIEANRQTTIHQSDKRLLMSPGNVRLVPVISELHVEGEVTGSPDTSWESIQCAGEEEIGRYDSNPETQVEPWTTANSGPKHTNDSIRNPMGPNQRSDFVGNELEQNPNDILDLYFTEDEAEGDSGYATSRQLSLKDWGKGTSPEPEDSDQAPTTALRYHNRNGCPFPPRIPLAQASRGMPDCRRDHGGTEDKPWQHEESTLSTRTVTATPVTHLRPSVLRQHALFSGDHPQSPGSRRWNGSVGERREINSGARLPVTHIDEFGNTWI